jgi:CubicO group peptidase (beta-lactamase class C family)
MKQKPKVWLVISIAVALAFIETSAQNTQPKAREEPTKQPTYGEFESWVNNFLAEHTDNSHMPTLGLVVVKDGDVFFQKIYGRSNHEGNATALSEQTIFRAASVSKLVTATAINQLVEQGNAPNDLRDCFGLTFFPIRRSKHWAIWQRTRALVRTAMRR